MAGYSAKYKQNSVYASTPMTSRYLDIFDPPDVSEQGDERTVALQQRHNFRPDILSNELSGSPRLWWVFTFFNRDILRDPVWDFKAGTSIKVPSNDNVSKYIL